MVPGEAFVNRNSPASSLTRCRIPAMPTPMLPGRNSATAAEIPVPSSRTVPTMCPSFRAILTQALLALEWRKTFVSASWIIRNAAFSRSGASLGKTVGYVQRTFNTGALREAVDVPLQGRVQADFVEHWRMQEVRHAAHLLHCMINDGASLFRSAASGRSVMRIEAVENHFRRRQILPQAVVKLTRNAAPLFVLRSDDAGGKAAKLGVQGFQLKRVAVQFREDANLCAEQFGVHGDRNVVDRAALVTLQAIEISQVHCRNENDRHPLEARVLADHLSKFEAVEFRHAYVQQNNGDVILEQLLERFFSGVGLDQIVAKFAEDCFVGKKFGRLVVDHQDVDFFSRAHFVPRPYL